MVCLDQEGIVFNVSSFFAARDVEIAELSTRTYAAAHTGTPMFSVQASVNVPAKASIAQLREEFLQLCDSLNIDGIIEPVKV
jgi:glycine cleavage system transcriptional repressor